MMVYVSLLSKLPHEQKKALMCSRHETLSGAGSGEQPSAEKTRLEENYKKCFLSYTHGKKCVDFF